MPEIDSPLRVKTNRHILVTNQLTHVPVITLKVDSLNLAGHIRIRINQQLL